MSDGGAIDSYFYAALSQASDATDCCLDERERDERDEDEGDSEGYYDHLELEACTEVRP